MPTPLRMLRLRPLIRGLPRRGTPRSPEWAWPWPRSPTRVASARRAGG